MDLYAAPECPVNFEVREEQLLRLRPACPLGFPSTHEAVRLLLLQAGPAKDARLHFGRIAEYPWLSEIVARQASASRRWNPADGRPLEGSAEQYVAAALRGIPEFTVLFDRWLLASVSVEKVLVRRAAELPLAAGAPVAPDARLPYDGIVIVRLQRR